MMYKCSNCGAYLYDENIISVAYDGGKKADVCPECFAELCNSLEAISEEEEAEVRREWRDDD